jgi:hypothetical protein
VRRSHGLLAESKQRTHRFGPKRRKAMLRRAARRLSSSVKAQRNEAIQKRRDARLKTITIMTFKWAVELAITFLLVLMAHSTLKLATAMM